VERFDDQPLGDAPHLAVLFQDKLGGFVVATPLLRGLKEKYPGAVLDYFGGERTAELEAACRHIDARFSLYGRPDGVRVVSEFLAEREHIAGPYALAINLDFNPLNAVVTAMTNARYVVGRCLRMDGRGDLPWGPNVFDRIQDPQTFWASESFMSRFGDHLSSNFIGEIFCRAARVQTDFQRTEVPTAPPPIPVPDVLVATGGTRSAKLWPVEYWKELISRCTKAGLSVGLLGAAPSLQKAAYGSADTEALLLSETGLIDLRGKLTLPEVAGSLAHARGCVTIDNGIMHLAAAVGVPTVALFGASPAELWAPRLPWLEVSLPTVECSLCRENRFLNEGCLRERHVCMESITPERVFQSLLAKLRPVPRRQSPQH
jgi:heptosyltransferase-3